MKVDHVISSLSSSSGGPARSVPLLCTALAEYVDVDISTVHSHDEVTVDETVSVKSFPSSYSPFHIGCSVALRNHLMAADCDVINAHGLWQMSTHYAVEVARKRSKPIVITPRGMLEPGALQYSRWKKRLAGWVWQNRDLNKATCIHVTSKMEADNCRQYGLKNPIAIVPNGIYMAEFPLKPVAQVLRDQKDEGISDCVKADAHHERKISTKRKRTLLFLSRIHQKKGLVYLLKAWSQLKHLHDEWHLVIAGNDEGGHEAELRNLAFKLGLWSEKELLNTNINHKIPKNSVYFAGPLFGDEKLKAYQDADLFVLPTLSENFGMVVLEALACGTPVITTKGAPWEELTTTKSGWWIDNGIEPLKECLQTALSCSNLELIEMGIRGRKLVENNYSINSVAKQMMQVYKWCLSKGSPPGCMKFF